MIEKKNALSVMVAALMFTACGGGGSSGGGSSGTTSGLVVDDYVAGAAVLCDSNGNGVADSGEDIVTTNSSGSFTFSSACTSTIVATGGTNVDTSLPFTGTLMAPAGSGVVTPLTSLMVGTGVSSATVAAGVGLPAGTNVTQDNPGALTMGVAAAGPTLLQSTLSVQQVLQQIALAIETAVGNTTVTANQAIYTEVANAAASVIASNTLISSNGNVSLTAVDAIVRQAVTNVSNSSNPVLSGVKATIARYSGHSIAALIGESITVQAEFLATVNITELELESIQVNVTIPNAVLQLSPLLTDSLSGVVDMSGVGIALGNLNTAMINGDSAGQAAAHAAATSAVNTQSANAGVTVTFDPTTLNVPTNYLAIVNDSVTLNGTAYTLSQFQSGISIVGASDPSFDTVGFTFDVNGAPIPANSSGARTVTVSAALQIQDPSSTRLAQVMITEIDVSVDSQGKISVTVPAGAVAYAYGRTSSGATANITLTNIDANTITVVNNALSFNMGSLFEKIGIALEGNQTAHDVFESLQNVKGTFDVKFAISTLDMRQQNGTQVQGYTIPVTGSGQTPVSGLGVAGVVTIQ